MSELRGSNGNFTPTQNALLIEAGEFNPQGWLKQPFTEEELNPFPILF